MPSLLPAWIDRLSQRQPQMSEHQPSYLPPSPDPVSPDRKVALLGVMQALFEASMYTFVFLWTPALSPAGEKIPHGMVFSCFMTACMAGSALTGLLMRRMHVERFMVGSSYCQCRQMSIVWESQQAAGFPRSLLVITVCCSN